MSVTYPIPVDPPGISARGKGTVLFVPSIANLSAPTVAEISAGLNLSCAIYAFNVTPTQNAVSKAKYCYATEVQRAGTPSYAIDAIVYDYDPQNLDAGDYGYYAELAPGTNGYLIDRRGLTRDVAAAAGQNVDIYPVELGIQGRVAIDPTADGETLRVTQGVFVIGDPAIDTVIAA
ncbi:hypothetical protein GCM10009785_26710 [Brooklawnia cerclae]|uniref:Uncharacterized protein n=1 Tax=Brooklawnia cerclae TaxID=349934 RepID=A0ABX0SG01_9ACTN|nr:hypothetical protein [Brooklawnia cerclae]NIH57320.1 hypothetical protein [Brooklawnia cerclae]